MTASLIFSVANGEQGAPFDLVELPEIVEAIGSDSFADSLLSCFDKLLGADHCSVYRLEGFELSEVASASVEGARAVARSDLTVYEVRRQLSMSGTGLRIDVANISDDEIAQSPVRTLRRHQRVMICARRPEASYCLQIMRSAHQAELTDEDVKSLRQAAGIVISAIVKHLDLTLRRPNLTPALSLLENIETCILSSKHLSRREGEVCARILYGLSSIGIALDLGIGKESVMTYRKRAYQRLGIGCRRELLMWYLALWSGGQPSNTQPTLN